MDLYSLRVKDLTEMCKKLGIKTGGRKAEIVERIQSHPSYQKEAQAANGRHVSTSSSKRHASGDLMDASHSAKKPKKQEKESHAAINKLFDEFHDPEDEDAITDDGIEALCTALGIDTQDPVVLALSWQMEAERMCVFTREEFVRGLEKLRCCSIEDLKKKIPMLRNMLTNREDFTSIYSYSFGFAKEPDQKNLQQEIALALWEILLPNYFPLLSPWLRFVKAHCRNSISKDLWMQVLEFGHQVKPDLSNFDENSAWPVLIDDFVSHLQERIAKVGLEAALKEGNDGDAVMEDA